MKLIKTIGITLAATGLVLTGIAIAPSLHNSKPSADTVCTTDNSTPVPTQHCSDDSSALNLVPATQPIPSPAEVAPAIAPASAPAQSSGATPANCH